MGHYVSLEKGENYIHEYDDETVYECGADYLSRKSAEEDLYILFYQRKDAVAEMRNEVLPTVVNEDNENDSDTKMEMDTTECENVEEELSTKKRELIKPQSTEEEEIVNKSFDVTNKNQSLSTVGYVYIKGYDVKTLKFPLKNHSYS